MVRKEAGKWKKDSGGENQDFGKSSNKLASSKLR